MPMSFYLCTMGHPVLDQSGRNAGKKEVSRVLGKGGYISHTCVQSYYTNPLQIVALLAIDETCEMLGILHLKITVLHCEGLKHNIVKSNIFSCIRKDTKAQNCELSKGQNCSRRYLLYAKRKKDIAIEFNWILRN